MNAARKERKRVEIYLINGIRLTGCIESFDQYLVMLRTPVGLQGIYKRAISTIQLDTGTRPGPRGPRTGGHGERYGSRDNSGSSFREPREPREAHGTSFGSDRERDRTSDGPVVVTRRRRPFSTAPHHTEPGSNSNSNSDGSGGDHNEE